MRIKNLKIDRNNYFDGDDSEHHQFETHQLNSYIKIFIFTSIMAMMLLKMNAYSYTETCFYEKEYEECKGTHWTS